MEVIYDHVDEVCLFQAMKKNELFLIENTAFKINILIFEVHFEALRHVVDH